MSRTLNRPLVKGTVTKKSLFTFNFILVFSGTITLLSVNLITTFLSLFGFLGYTIIYSMVDVTLKEGIEKELLSEFPDELKGVKDITEHSAGEHSYY